MADYILSSAGSTFVEHINTGGQVGTTDIADGAVTTAKIDYGAVTPVKLSFTTYTKAEIDAKTKVVSATLTSGYYNPTQYAFELDNSAFKLAKFALITPVSGLPKNCILSVRGITDNLTNGTLIIGASNYTSGTIVVNIMLFY